MASTYSTMVAVFRRNGSAGQNTRLFEDFSNDVRSKILNNIDLHDDEQIAVGHFIDEENWLVVSTHRIAWRRDGKTRSLSNERIVDVTFDRAAAIASGASKTHDLRRLLVTDDQGNNYGLEVDPGYPFSATWNVIKYLARRSSDAAKSND